jgi:hypothetical protein
MTEPADYRQYICGCRIVACVMANRRWCDQCGCAGAVKDSQRDRCWYLTSDGICERDRVEHEARMGK